MTKPFNDDIEPKRKRSLFAWLRGSFLTGLVVVAPISLTLYLIWTVAGWVDSWVLPFVPVWLRPDQYVGLNVRGVGVFVFLIFTILVGWIAKGIIGKSMIAWAENLVQGLPVVRSVYNGLKQIAETVFAQSDSSFDKACLIQYPRKGIWCIAFISTSAKGEIAASMPTEDDKTAVFLPTTPNPTSGFVIMLPREDVIVLDMDVDEALKMIISLGVVVPDWRNSKTPDLPLELPDD